MKQHTPGPWMADLVCNKVRANDGEIDICRTYGDVSIAEENANARLIASAPDLLLALEYMLDRSECESDRKVARAAISKAQGEA